MDDQQYLAFEADPANWLDGAADAEQYNRPWADPDEIMRAAAARIRLLQSRIAVIRTVANTEY